MTYYTALKRTTD